MRAGVVVRVLSGRRRPTEKFAEQTGKAVRGEQATRATARKPAARSTPVEGVTATEPTSPAEAGE